MIRWILGALVLLGVAAPLSAQLVGHLPEESPYIDVTGRHSVSAQLGMILPAKDIAGVGPQTGLVVMGRYEYDLPGPMFAVSRLGIAPGLSRNVKDPELTGSARDVGTRTESLLLLDAGLVLSLTGDKSWRGLAPRIHGNIGMVSSFASDFDVGGYRFGPKFMPSWGLSLRGVRDGAFEWNADLTQAFWRLQYPPSYGDPGTTVTPSIIGNAALNPWTSNLILSVGISRVWKR